MSDSARHAQGSGDDQKANQYDDFDHRVEDIDPTVMMTRDGGADGIIGRAQEPPRLAREALIKGIVDRLRHYLDSPEMLTDFRPMQEWTLSTQGRVTEIDILQAYRTATSLAVAEEEDLDAVQPHPQMSYDYLEQTLSMPLSWDSESVVLAVATPYRIGDLAWQWRQLFGLQARFLLCRRSQLERAITALYEEGTDESDMAGLGADADASEQTLRDLALEAPIVRLVNDMFSRAIEMGASDIHVEPQEEELSIRFRIDGLLHTVMSPPIGSYPAISSRIKLIGGLNIAERRLPQDGRTDLRVGRHSVDIRISTVPALHGESIVLRLLPKDISDYSIEKLGMEPVAQQKFTELIGFPHGMILVVGPTGSGKTTTLYCAMRLLNSEDTKIITIEDPIEYQIRGVTQIQVKPSIGLTFAGGLRHIVRQDPDIILVGEIRDRETAEIAIHAALTGHLVLSTLHTNDATGAISRLIDMGVEDFLLSSALVGVLSQRLVRRVCGSCDGKGFGAGAPAGGAAKTCRTCNGTGYRGRLGIFELLVMDDDIRGAIRSGSDNATLNAIARRNGMSTLREDGDRQVVAGNTTAEEVARVCKLDA